MSEHKPPSGKTSAILGDLESIRSLLEEHQEAGPQEPDLDDDQVPLLEDVVDGGVTLNESFLSGEGSFQESGDSGGDDRSSLNDEIFKALLSDEWRESARGLLDEARDAIEAQQTAWTPQHTDELNAALQVRIDETLHRWLRQAVLNGIDDLRREVLESVRQELGRTVAARFNSKSPHEDLDGA